MSFLSSRLFPLTRIVSLKARQSLLRGISQNSTSAASKETLLLSDSCVKKLRDVCDDQFLRVTVSKTYNFLADISLFRLLYSSTSTMQGLEISTMQNLEISRPCVVEVDE